MLASMLSATPVSAQDQPAPETLEEAPPATDAPKKKDKKKKQKDAGAGDQPETPTEAPADPDPAPENPGTENPNPNQPPAQPSVDVEELIRLQELYDEAIGEEADALARWELATAKLSKIESRISRVRGMLSWTKLEIELGLERVDEANAARERAEVELARVQQELEDETQRLKRHAIEAFIGGASNNEDILNTMLNAESVDSVESVREYASVALEDQDKTVRSVERLEVRVDELVALKGDLEAEAEAELKQIEAYEAEISERIATLDSLQIEASAESAEIAAEVAAIQTRKADYSQRLNAIQIDSDSAALTLQRAQAAQAPGPPPILHPPVLGITRPRSDFGPRLHPIFGSVRMHNGNDFGGGFGDPIFASAAGVVVMAELRGGYGNVVVIDHGDQWGTLYAHQSSFEVVVGQQVARGDIIGRVGSTGYSTGPHLHFELRNLGAPRDAWDFIAFAEPNPVPCDILVRSGHPNDIAAAQDRDDCADYFEDSSDEDDDAAGAGDGATDNE